MARRAREAAAPRVGDQGIAGLRVADASVMPTVTTGNTNAPSIMIGERAAEFMLADAGGRRAPRGSGPPLDGGRRLARERTQPCHLLRRGRRRDLGASRA